MTTSTQAEDALNVYLERHGHHADAEHGFRSGWDAHASGVDSLRLHAIGNILSSRVDEEMDRLRSGDGTAPLVTGADVQRIREAIYQQSGGGWYPTPVQAETVIDVMRLTQ